MILLTLTPKNQFLGHEDGNNNNEDDTATPTETTPQTHEEDDELIRLAKKQRMNGTTRQSLFCLVMSSNDAEDAFEKLVRGEYFTSRRDRDVVRVVVECCGNEKHYNPFYAHLLVRVVRFRTKSRFTLQLSLWDVFKKWDGVGVRSAANWGKLVLRLVKEKCLSVNNFLKGMEDLKMGC